jgi:opacity protein-like surface antigen
MQRISAKPDAPCCYIHILRRTLVKKSHIIAGLTALTAIAATSAARADDERWPRWYIGLSGGYTYMQDQDVSGATSATKLSPNDGWGLGGSIGYLPSSSMPLLNALRFEAEVTYHQNDVHSIHFNNGTSASGSGTYDSTAYMFNAFYDFPIAGSNWSPYIGGGVGMATLHLSSNSGLGNAGSSDNEFAYQGMAGIGYAPETLPNTQWTLGYRYLATSDAKFGGTDVQYSTNNIELGAKFRF